MFKTKSQVIKPYVYTDSIFRNLFLEERCLLELIWEQYEKAELKERNRITLKRDCLEAKIAQRRREKIKNVNARAQSMLPQNSFLLGE